ncbi:MAG: hypothetical protein MJ103_05735 [Saccharofermentans sp.]|nr:hypothetical protein [Saccharofermentans sp.]
MFLWILAGAFGLFMGAAIALSIFSKMLDKSNNIGDSTSTFDDVCPEHVEFTYKNTYENESYKNQFLRDHGLRSYAKQGIKMNDYGDLLDDNIIPDELPDVDIPLFKPLV